MRYFLHFAYQGYKYRGWQQQPGNLRTVQGVMENVLQRILKHPVSLVGCGRTDAQVHASQFFAHFDTTAKLTPQFLFILNKNLPEDISIFDIIEVGPRAHARYDAKERQYDYLIHTEKHAFLETHSALYEFKDLRTDLMQEAADMLLQYEDFRGYCLTPDRHNTTLCKVHYAKLTANEEGTRLRFTIKANRYLRGMIRILVYQLLEVGSGKINLETFQRPLREGLAPVPLRSAHPQGLYLSRIEYPDIQISPKIQPTNNW